MYQFSLPHESKCFANRRIFKPGFHEANKKTANKNVGYDLEKLYPTKMKVHLAFFFVNQYRFFAGLNEQKFILLQVLIPAPQLLTVNACSLRHSVQVHLVMDAP